MADDKELVAVVPLLRPGQIKVTDPAKDWWQTIGIPTWTDDRGLDTAHALEQLREAGYVPAEPGQPDWRLDQRGFSIEVRRA